MKIARHLAIAWFGTVLITANGDTNTFSNPTFGISVTKPGEWHFLTAREHRENLERTQLGDEEFQKLVQKYSSAPLVAMTKYKEPYNDINPSLQMHIKPLGKLPSANPKAILSIVATNLPSRRLEGFKIIIPPRDTTVAKQKAAYMKVHYAWEIKGVGKFPVCSEMWIVPRRNFFYMIGGSTRQDEKTGERREIRQIIESIKFE